MDIILSDYETHIQPHHDINILVDTDFVFISVFDSNDDKVIYETSIKMISTIHFRILGQFVNFNKLNINFNIDMYVVSFERLRNHTLDITSMKVISGLKLTNCKLKGDLAINNCYRLNLFECYLCAFQDIHFKEIFINHTVFRISNSDIYGIHTVIGSYIKCINLTYTNLFMLGVSRISKMILSYSNLNDYIGQIDTLEDEHYSLMKVNQAYFNVNQLDRLSQTAINYFIRDMI